jgi:hypothetical protein
MADKQIKYFPVQQLAPLLDYSLSGAWKRVNAGDFGREYTLYGFRWHTFVDLAVVEAVEHRRFTRTQLEAALRHGSPAERPEFAPITWLLNHYDQIDQEISNAQCS